MSPCGKVWYASEAHALVKLATKQTQWKKVWAMEPYYCDDCDGWHLGHNYLYYNRDRSLCIGEHA